MKFDILGIRKLVLHLVVQVQRTQNGTYNDWIEVSNLPIFHSSSLSLDISDNLAKYVRKEEDRRRQP